MVKNPMWTFCFCVWGMVGLFSSWEGTWEGDETQVSSWQQDQKLSKLAGMCEALCGHARNTRKRAHKIGPEMGTCNFPKSTFSKLLQAKHASHSAEDLPQKVIMFYDGSDAEIVESLAWSMESCQPGDPLPINWSPWHAWTIHEMTKLRYGTIRHAWDLSLHCELHTVQNMYAIIQDTYGPSRFQGVIGELWAGSSWCAMGWMLESARVKWQVFAKFLGSPLITVTHDLHRPSRENHFNLTAKESSPCYEMRDSTQILGDCRLHCRKLSFLRGNKSHQQLSLHLNPFLPLHPAFRLSQSLDPKTLAKHVDLRDKEALEAKHEERNISHKRMIIDLAVQLCICTYLHMNYKNHGNTWACTSKTHKITSKFVAILWRFP